jgi:hypothetical protein
MKANEAPEKLYLSKNIYSTFIYQVPDSDDETAVEYIRKDTFIEKVCDYFAPHISDNSGGYDRARIIEGFKKYIEE